MLAAAGAFSVSLLAQDPPADAANGNAGRRGGRGQGGGFGGGQGRGNFNPEEMQARVQAQMRELYGVTDDAEWKIISDRIIAIQELQRTQAAAGGGGMAMLAGGGRGGQGGGGFGGRGGRGGDPNIAALRQAIQDKAPDAEIKARLAAVREARKASEERLTKAQEDLRALLDVRQEAVAVMSGLLP